MTELFARVKMADYFFFTLCSLSFASQDKLKAEYWASASLDYAQNIANFL